MIGVLSLMNSVKDITPWNSHQKRSAKVSKEGTDFRQHDGFHGQVAYTQPAEWCLLLDMHTLCQMRELHAASHDLSNVSASESQLPPISQLPWSNLILGLTPMQG